MTALAPPRGWARTLTASRARPALGWAVATFVVLAALAGGPGISRDEAAVLAAAERGPAVLANPRAWGDAARPAPPLAPALAWAGEAALSPLRIGHLRAARLGTAALAALLSACIALLAFDLSGAPAALLAPALFWLAPRHLQAGLSGAPDLALAALSVAAAMAFRRAAVLPERRARLRAAARAGLLFGGALAARTDAWVLFAALALYAVALRVTRPGPPREAEDEVEVRLHGIPPALAAMAVLGPLVLAAAWPWLWGAPLARVAAAFAPAGGGAAWSYLGAPLRGRFPAAYPLVVTALTLPASLLWAYAGGAAHAALRLARAARRRAPATDAPDEVLLLACAAAPLVAAAAGLAPSTGGVRPWLAALPFLAVAGARVLLSVARVAWPERAAPLAATLALLALYPALRATVHFHPAGSAAWNELAGGAPGAASLGMQRQDGGEATAAVLESVNASARPGARIWFGSTPPSAVRVLALDGRLRPDLTAADAPEDADLAIVTIDGSSRDAEYRAWAAFGTARPAAGVYLDEVPLAFVYARPGAWR